MTSKLTTQTKALSTLATSSLRWVEHHAAEAAGSIKLSSLRRERRLAQRLYAAASRPSAVAVYGASQAGKSYLMSSLSSPGQGRMTVNYGTETLDFLSDMNPEGGDESSGLVSRFTLTPPTPPSNTTPVPVRLLSMTDLIRIIGNTFLSDFRLTTIKPQTPDDILKRLENTPRQPNSNIFTIDDIELLEEYFKTKFGDKNWIDALPEKYWHTLGAIAKDLSLHSLMSVLSPLWGDTAALTAYATEMLHARHALGRESLAFCGTDALKPRSDSILDVSTLFKPRPGAPAIRLVNENGRESTLPRHIVSAIVAELVVPLNDTRWDFVRSTDLLDFPGARSRLIIHSVEEIEESCGRLFLRGKVDYLFELYQNDMEVTSLLLCVPDSVQNVNVLPGMIKGWIESTIGKTPAERSHQTDSLFLILTKFDKQFEQKGGADDTSSTGWDTRLNASILNNFVDDWVREWKPGQPFNNVQWLRAWTMGNLYRRDPQGAETEMLPETEDLVSRRRTSYLASDPVKIYIKDAQRAFDEAIRPNDGGITYLAERLKPVSESTAKQDQLAARFATCRKSIHDLVQPLYHDVSNLESGEEARKAVASIATALVELHRNRLFGAFLLRLGLDRAAIIDQWRNFSSTIDHAPPAPPADDLLGDILGDALPTSAPQEDQHDRFATLVIDYWINNRLLSLPTDPKQLSAFSLEANPARQFIERLQKLAETQKLRDQIAERLRAQCNHVSTLNLSGEKQALICAELIGRFITYLGYADLPEQARPRQRTNIPIFQTPAPTRDYPALTETPSIYLDAFFRDWVLALRSRFEESGPQFDIAANEALGTLLAELKSIAP